MKSRWIRFDCKHNENVSRSVGQILGLVKLFDLPWFLWAVSKHLCRRVLHSEGGEKIKGCCSDPGKPQDEVFGDLSSATRGHGLNHRLSFLGVGACMARGVNERWNNSDFEDPTSLQLQSTWSTEHENHPPVLSPRTLWPFPSFYSTINIHQVLRLTSNTISHFFPKYITAVTANAQKLDEWWERCNKFHKLLFSTWG